MAVAAVPSSGVAGGGREVPVWDPLVRVLHWALAAAFATAFLTAEEARGVHEAAGYLVGGIVAVRVLWGFIGTPHARFVDFVRPPAAALDYLKGLLTGRGERHLGHNPAGGLMIVALLAMLAVTVGTGLLLEEAHAEAFEEVHEVAANLTLALVFAHVAGVALGSLVHRENLVKAMITGRKDA